MQTNNIFKGEWMETQNKMKQFWNWLSDENLKSLQDNEKEIYPLLQKHYGYSREQAERAVNDFQQKYWH